jgi:hypothetical protein
LTDIILGSGLNGLLAHLILGEQSKFIAYKKSRFFSHQIPISDNHIEASEDGPRLATLIGLPLRKKYFPVAVSYRGELIFNKRTWASTIVDKVFQSHPAAYNMLCRDFNVYELTAKSLYDLLISKYQDEILKSPPQIIRILDKRVITSDGTEISYDRIISTIPLNALLELVGDDSVLKSLDYHVFLMATDVFNLEGAQRCYIGDVAIPFWKVNVLNNNLYQFFANSEVSNAEKVFSLLAKDRFRIISNTIIKEAFPDGAPPIEIIKKLESKSIFCIGSNARWDYFFDIASSISKLFSLK